MEALPHHIRTATHGTCALRPVLSEEVLERGRERGRVVGVWRHGPRRGSARSSLAARVSRASESGRLTRSRSPQRTSSGDSSDVICLRTSKRAPSRIGRESSRPVSDRAYCSARSARGSDAKPAHTASLRTRAGSSRRNGARRAPPTTGRRDRSARHRRPGALPPRARGRAARVASILAASTITRRPAAPTPRARCRCRAVAVQQDEVAHALVTVTDLLAYRDRFPILEHTTYL